MYRGNNPIALRSQHMILNALNELMIEKDLRDISVSEICVRSGISRQTFYKLFGTKENVLLFKLENAKGFFSQSGDFDKLKLSEICERFVRCITDNYRIFKTLIENDMIGVLYERIYACVSSCRSSFVQTDDKERECAAHFISAGLCGLTQKIIKEYEKPDRYRLTQLLHKIMSGEIFRS